MLGIKLQTVLLLAALKGFAFAFRDAQEINPELLQVNNKRLLQLVVNVFNCDDDSDSDGGDGGGDGGDGGGDGDGGDSDGSDSGDIDPSPTPSIARSNPPSMYPSPTPSFTIYEEKKLVASDGSSEDIFGRSCSISDDLLVFGAPDNEKGAAYIFHFDGTEVKKLTAGDDGKDNEDEFGMSVAIDEKVVVGSKGDYIRVFSRQGAYERTIKCNDCSEFGQSVATHGNLIVTKGKQNSSSKLFIHTIQGELLKSFELGGGYIEVAISKKFVVLMSYSGNTIVYSNSEPGFPKMAEFNQGGGTVAVSSDRIVIGNQNVNDHDGAAWLYTTDGTLITALDRRDSASNSEFGNSVAIIDDKVIVGAEHDGAENVGDPGYRSGSVFIYSAIDGEFIEKVVAPDGKEWDYFGWSVCASHSHYAVGAIGVDDKGNKSGAGYLLNYSS